MYNKTFLKVFLFKGTYTPALFELNPGVFDPLVWVHILKWIQSEQLNNQTLVHLKEVVSGCF